MALTPSMIIALTAVAAEAEAAGHGNKSAIYARACTDLVLSNATLMRHLKQVTVRKPRRQRSDANHVTLTRDEALHISAMLTEAARKNNKRIMCVADAADILRANNAISAQRIDPNTGEIKPLSPNAIARALRVHKLHPDQLMQPAPVTALASLHPNHMWCVDASLCILYYLPKVDGLQVMDAKEFYKNKPANAKRVENDMVWRYVVTDHTSGWVYVEYVLGGETGRNLCTIFINAMQKRGVDDPVHGVPLMAMLDPGSANTGALFKNLCLALQINLQINEVGNPRAKGQVEKGQDIVECSFESKLRFVKEPVTTLDHINQLSQRWMVWFNANKIHTRTGKTRYDAWLTITPAQLRIAPSVTICRELTVSAPESRLVTPGLTVNFGGAEYDVSAVPSVMVGEKLMVCRNAYRTDAVNIALKSAYGDDIFCVAPVKVRNEFGFFIDAPVVGEQYKQHADTPAQTAAKEIGMLVTGETTLEGVKAKRKAKAVPFAGQIDPFKAMEQDAKRHYLPRAGTVSTVAAPLLVIKPWSHTKAALAMSKRGIKITDAVRVQIAALYPDGVPESDLDTLAACLQAPETNDFKLRKVS
jgi:hypothetical protein